MSGTNWDNDAARAALSPVWTHASDVVVDHARGCRIHGTDGRDYLDFTSGIGVTNTGHCHPRVVEAIQSQAESLVFGQVNIVTHRPMLELVERLRTVVPAELDAFFFSNSGAEAVEASIKLAKAATGRPNVIVMQGSFHGRTHLTMGMTTSKTIYRAGYQPLVPGTFVVPFPYTYYYESRYGWDAAQTLQFSLDELDRLFKSQSAPDETAAIIVEPVLGEGGYVPAPEGFLAGLRERADKHGILLVADEVQSGFGRTGTFFAFEYDRVVPDIVVMAKGIASGMPLSGIAYRGKLSEKWKPGSHGGTYGGNPVSCAAAVATFDVIRDEALIDNARARGEQLQAALRDAQRDYPRIGDVRGRGLMVATEFTTEGRPDDTLVAPVKKAALDRGLLLLSCGTFGNVIRWIPPLVVSAEEIDRGAELFREALAEVST